jgi:hypothetical protein
VLHPLQKNVLTTNKKPCRVELPRFAIANGALFGEAPMELMVLNDCKLALVSRARTNKHVFAFFGGAHKCMQGWHNLYENDVEGIARTVNQIPNYTKNSMVMCDLLGPFTPLKKRFVKSSVMIRPDMVLRALCWLKMNNVLYHDINLPAEGDLPMTHIIDRSQHANSQDTNIES